jgi:alcohol dehydrogenase class IV
MRARAPRHPALARYVEVARLLTGAEAAHPEDCVEPLRALAVGLRIPGLRRWGVTESDLPELAVQASRSSSMKANPVELKQDELLGCLAAAL